MSEKNEEFVESQVVKDTKSYNKWFDENIIHLTAKAKETGLESKLREIMRMAWRKCSELKNAEAATQVKIIDTLKSEIESQKKKYDELHMELQKVTNKLIQAEKNARK